MEKPATISFNGPLVNALLSTDAISIACFNQHFEVSNYNSSFEKLLRLRQKVNTLKGFGLFRDGELEQYMEELQTGKSTSFNFIRKLVHEDDTILIASVKLIGAFQYNVFSGGWLLLEDVTIKESIQAAVNVTSDHYKYQDLGLFFKKIFRMLSVLLNIPVISISNFENERFNARFIWSNGEIKTDLGFHFEQKDIQLIKPDQDNIPFVNTNTKVLKSYSRHVGLAFSHSQGILLYDKNRVIGCLHLLNTRPLSNQMLIKRIVPLVTEKISKEINFFEHQIGLIRREALFRNLFEESPLGILMICNETARIENANPRICTMLGYSEVELKQKTAYDLTHPDDHTIHKEKFRKSREENYSPFDFEKRYIKKSGEVIWVNIAASTVRDPQGAIIYDLAAIQDITEKHQAKELIKKQVKELNLQNQKLEQYIESNSQLENFAYIASHDLKAPLRTIGNFTQLLRRKIAGMMTQEEQEYMNFVLEAVKDMNKLIDDLLIYSKINSMENIVVKLDLQHILNNVKRNLNANIKEKNAVIIVDENIPEKIFANKTKLTQLFQNLIANGIKFQKPDSVPEVHISCKEDDQYWRFQIKDNGIGIQKEYFEKIFALFKRLHGKKEFEGSGIGLAYCKRVVEKHKGEIWLESEPGAGTSFFFTIKKDLV